MTSPAPPTSTTACSAITDCGVILCLAGSLISAGLKKIFVDLIRNNMVDAIVSTGANIVDQDFFEALGFNHYIADDEYKYGTQATPTCAS